MSLCVLPRELLSDRTRRGFVTHIQTVGGWTLDDLYR